MATLNNVIILGRLVKDPEISVTQSGKKICRFTVAFDKRGKDAGCNFVDCVAWENNAEYISKYGAKGSQTLLQGRLDQQTWEKNGKKSSKIIVVADNLQLLSKVEAQKSSEYIPISKEYDKIAGDGDINLDDIPF